MSSNLPQGIILNGEKRLVSSQTVSCLLNELDLSGKKVAVEKNREIVSRDSYQDTLVESGDQIEIIQFVGGG